MDCVIYDASPGDIPEIEEIERQCFSMPWTEAQLASQLRGDRHEFLTAKAPDGTVCGYVGMMYVLDEGVPVWGDAGSYCRMEDLQ